MSEIRFLQRAPSAGWFILDVMRKGHDRKPNGEWKRGRPSNIWVALLVDVDPDLFCVGRGRNAKSCWVDLGRHRTRDDAWEYAEQLMETRH